MKLYLKHDTSNATQIAEPLSAEDFTPVKQSFVNVTGVTVPHSYTERLARVDLYTPEYYLMPQTRIKSIFFDASSVRVVFHNRESGTVVVRP